MTIRSIWQHKLHNALLYFCVFILISKSQDVHHKTVYEGDEVTLECPNYTFPPPGNLTTIYTLQWFNYVFGTAHRVAFCEYRFGNIHTEPFLQGSFADRGTYSDRGVISINSIQVSDEGPYICDFTNHPSQQVNLTVNVKPDQPVITTPSKEPIKESTLITFTCTINRIKPLPQRLVWTIYGSDEIIDDRIDSSTIDSDGVYEVTYQLQRNVTYLDHGKTLTCTVTPAGGHGDTLSASHTVLVLYSSKGTPSISVEDGTLPPDATARFTCDTSGVIANPVINSYMWFKDEELQSTTTTSSWELNVSLDSKGNYRCKVANKEFENQPSVSSNLVALDVNEDFSGPNGSVPSATIAGVVSSVVIIVIIIIVVIVTYMRHKKKSSSSENASARHKTVDTVDKSQPEIYDGPQLGMSTYDDIDEPDWNIHSTSVEVVRILSKGQFGVFKLAKAINVPSVPNGRFVTLRSLGDNIKAQDAKAFYEEAEALKALTPHPNVVQLVNCCFDKDPPFYILRIGEHEYLSSYLMKHKPPTQGSEYENMEFGKNNSNVQGEDDYEPLQTNLKTETLKKFGEETLQGLLFLHQNKMLHPCLSCDNLLLTGHLQCKLTGFMKSDHAQARVRDDVKLRRLGAAWCAPETISKNILTMESNVWSAGMTLWQIFALGECPYTDLEGNGVMKAVTAGTVLSRPGECPMICYELMLTCWKRDPTDRPSLQEVISKLHHFEDKPRYSSEGGYMIPTALKDEFEHIH